MDQLIIPTFIIALLALLIAMMNTFLMIYYFFFRKEKISDQNHQQKTEYTENIYVTVRKLQEFKQEMIELIESKQQSIATKEIKTAEQKTDVDESKKETKTQGYFGYPKGEANNYFFTEIQSNKDNAKFYATIIGNDKAEFKPLNIRDLKETDGLMKVIDVENGKTINEANRFEILDCGIAKQQDNNWIIEKKAKIKLL